MENEEKTTFSLADGDDEIVEEEVIDRDEEYEDDDYDDEEYDDEDYGDEEYDDGYNDDYYDDRLDKVLDEIAELKRGMAPSTAVQQPGSVFPPMPQYVYQATPPGPPSAGSEVLMYNEISRLRDELAKNQNNLEMQKELTRIKEDMARDQRFAESQYNAEIKRLQDRIDDLLKNAESSQDELPPANEQMTQLESGKSNKNGTLDFDKLLSINESILRSMRESDSRLQNEISQLRSKVEAMPSSEELGRAVSALKKLAHSGDAMGAENLAKLSNDIASLRAAIGDGHTVRVQSSATPVIVQGNNSGSDVNASELLRQLYEIRNALGSSSTAAVNRTQVLLDLVADFRKVSFDVQSKTTSLKDKLTSVYNYVKKLEDSNEPDAFDLIKATNELIQGIAVQDLDRQSFDDFTAYLAANGSTVPAQVRESAVKFFGICDKVDALEDLDSITNYLPDLLVERNKLENNRYADLNNKLVSDITNAMLEEDRDEDAIRDNVAKLASITVADIAELPLIDMPQNYNPTHTVTDETVFSKLAELKAVFDDYSIAQKAAAEQSRLDEQDYNAVTQDDGGVTLHDVFDAIDELRVSVAQQAVGDGEGASGDVTAMLEEIRNNYLDLSERIIEISDLIASQSSAAAEEPKGDADEIAAENQQTVEDLAYIRARLDEQEDMLRQLDEIRADIVNLTVPAASDNPEQATVLTNYISEQFDKLYEDLANAIADSEANLTAKLTEPEAVEDEGNDALEAVRSDILLETQDIKDTLALISESVAGTAVLDAIESVRADVVALADLTSANAEVAGADRQRLLDDLAFLREQAEAAINSQPEDDMQAEEAAQAAQESEKIFAYLDELASRVAVLTTVPDYIATAKDTLNLVADDVALTRDTVTAVSDNVTALTDSVNVLNDNVAAVAGITEDIAVTRDAVTAVSDNVTALTDSVNVLNDNVAAVAGIAEDVATTRDTAAAALDALAPIADQLTEILNRLDESAASVVDEQTTVSEEAEGENTTVVDLGEIKENLNTILDTLPLLPQSDDVLTARDNTFSILDTLTMMPQSEDVVTTRDNVAAILDSVNALREAFEASDANADSDSIANIVQDIGIVLDKLEAFEQSAVTDKQEILDAVAGIREDIHIGELDENMAANGFDDETRDVLIGDISEIRERLSNIENNAIAVNDANVAALDQIAAQLADIQNQLAVQPVGDGEAVAEGEAEYTSANINESIQALADELAAIREKIDAESEYDTIEEVLSLREDVKAARIVDQNEVAGELESIKNELAAISSGNILDEIRALREDIANASAVGEEATAPTGGELNLVLNEIVSLRDEVFAFKDEVMGSNADRTVGEATEAAPSSDEDVATILDEITALRADQTVLTENIDELKDIISRRTTITTETAEGQEVVADASNELNVVLGEIIDIKSNIERVEANLPTDRLDELTAQIEQIRALIDGMQANTVVTGEEGVVATEESVPSAIADDIAELKEEIALLRSENEELRRENADMVTSGLNELRDAIRDMTLSMTMAPTASAEGDTSYAALIEEIRSLKAEVAASKAESAQSEFDTSEVATLAGELTDIRDEIAQLRSLTTVTADNSGAVEIAAIRDEIAQLKSVLASPESFGNIAEDVTAIKADVQSIKDEPDLGVLNEILALRDEFQNLREQIEDVKSIAGKTDKESEDAILTEVQSLRDQIFAISMANVNDSESGETNYESYNNIILDELASIREQAESASSEEELKAVTAEIQDIKSALDKRDRLYDVLAKRVEKLDSDATNNKILEELESLKAELANQREADLTTLNFMSEMAQLIERQSADTKISDEIASLKAEIASASTDAVAEEIAQLRDIMMSGNAADNDAILNELAELRGQLSADKPNRENELILAEIARLRNELVSLKDGDRQAAESDLQGTLSDLKAELNEIAGIVEPTTAKKPAAKKPAAKKSTAKKSTAKKSADKTKTTDEAAVPNPTVTEQQEEVIATYDEPMPVEREEVDFDAMFNEELAKLTGTDGMDLDLEGPISQDELDVADKLARQVANKLIMEQLVEQLGDGGVSAERVHEILRDILPQEFTTVALNEQSDKVRKLANRLVLNKLRDRLGERKVDTDDDDE